jgi:hypothetical protein
MNCTEFHDLMQRRLDGETVAYGNEIAAHVAVCSNCRALRSAVQRLEIGLRAMPRPLPPIGLADSIVASVVADRRAVRRRGYAVRVIAALAAAVLIAVLIGQWFGRSKPNAIVPDDARLVVLPQEPEPPRPGPSLRESMTEVAQLTMHSADETVRNFIPKRPAPTAGSSPLESLREAGNSVTTGLEPVADSAKRALNLFLRDIPAARAEEKRGS